MAQTRFPRLHRSCSFAATLLLACLQPLWAQQGAQPQVIVHDLCDFRDHGAALPAGDYTARELAARGIPDNAISAIEVPRGWIVTVYEDDLFQGRHGSLRRDDACLEDDRFDNRISSVSVRRALGEVSETSDSGTPAVIGYAQCNYQGKASRLPPGDYNLAQLEAAGLGDNTLASLRVPDGMEITLYEHDFLRGGSGSTQRDVACLQGTDFAAAVSSVSVKVVDAEAAGTNTASENRTAAVELWTECGYRGQSVRLEPGEYLAETLAERGLLNNSISSIRVAEGYAVALFEHDFFRGRSGVLRQHDDCLANDRFDNAVSSLKVITDERSETAPSRPAAPQPQPKPRAAPRADATASPGETRRSSAPTLEDLLPAPPGSREAAAPALEQALACVEQFVEAGQCQSHLWARMVSQCRLERIELMNDGYFRGHVNAGNCQARYWPELARRVANPRLR